MSRAILQVDTVFGAGVGSPVGGRGQSVGDFRCRSLNRNISVILIAYRNVILHDLQLANLTVTNKFFF